MNIGHEFLSMVRVGLLKRGKVTNAKITERFAPVPCLEATWRRAGGGVWMFYAVPPQEIDSATLSARVEHAIKEFELCRDRCSSQGFYPEKP